MENTFLGYSDLKEFMREVRIKYHKSPEEIAEILGVKLQYIYMIEKGNKVPAFDKLAKFTSYFETPVNTAELLEAYEQAKSSGKNSPTKTTSVPSNKETHEESTTSFEKEPKGKVKPELNIQQPNEHFQTTLDALNSLDEPLRSELLENLQQGIETAKKEQQPTITFNELKKQLLTALQEWKTVNKYKDAKLEYKEEAILNIRGEFTPSEDITMDVLIKVDLNKAIFFAPKTEENFIKPLVDMFPGPKYKCYLPSHPGFTVKQELVEYIILNPTIMMLPLYQLLAESGNPQSHTELSDPWMESYLKTGDK